jgi:hypothetical protein
MTPLLAAAMQTGCQTIFDREMMRGQISKIVDYFEAQGQGNTASANAASLGG